VGIIATPNKDLIVELTQPFKLGCNSNCEVDALNTNLGSFRYNSFNCGLENKISRIAHNDETTGALPVPATNLGFITFSVF